MSMAASPSRSDPERKVGPVVVMGVSGCGKSSVGRELAARMGCRFVEGDLLHPAANVRKMEKGIPLRDEDRWPWLDLIGEHLGGEANLVVSCSALKRSYRDRLRAAAPQGVWFVFLNGSPSLLLQRMASRSGHFMPVSLLESQLETLEVPTGEPGVVTIDIDQALEAIVASAIAALTLPRPQI